MFRRGCESFATRRAGRSVAGQRPVERRAQVRLPVGFQDEIREKVTDVIAGEFGIIARQELKKFFNSDTELEHVLDGLRKAGIEFPEEPDAGL